MSRPSHLPDFENPPVDEVVIGLQYDRLVGFTDAHAGLFWQRVRAQYPRTQSRPRSELAIENLATAMAAGPSLPTFEVIQVDDSVGNRTWLISDDDSMLLQVQDTQFLRNWRLRDAKYPHLDEHAVAFWAAYDQFEALLDEERIERPVIRQLELSYFNWIPTDSPGFFNPIASAKLESAGLGPEPEQARYTATYLDRDESGTPRARLRVDLQPALKADEDGAQLGYRFVLSYRAPFSEPTREQLQAAIARGREVIDWSFVDLTSPTAHSEWGRIP